AGPGEGGESNPGGPGGGRGSPADREERGGVRAHSEEGDHAEIHEPRQAPLDVETEGQERAHPDQGGDGGEVGDHARAPASPVGRTRSTTRMIAKPMAVL